MSSHMYMYIMHTLVKAIVKGGKPPKTIGICYKYMCILNNSLCPEFYLEKGQLFCTLSYVCFHSFITNSLLNFFNSIYMYMYMYLPLSSHSLTKQSFLFLSLFKILVLVTSSNQKSSSRHGVVVHLMLHLNFLKEKNTLDHKLIYG